MGRALRIAVACSRADTAAQQPKPQKDLLEVVQEQNTTDARVQLVRTEGADQEPRLDPEAAEMVE